MSEFQREGVFRVDNDETIDSSDRTGYRANSNLRGGQFAQPRRPLTPFA